MINIQTLSGNDKSVRTQITLTEQLKILVEGMAQEKGESLSEYLRKAAMVRLLVEEDKKQDLEKIALRAVRSLDLKKHPEWNTQKKVYRWARKIREEK